MTSLTQLAQPYVLVTAKFPIDHVTPVWSQGCNRPLSESHCEQLRKTFRLGLHREDPQHHLRLACSKADLDQVRAHLQRRGRLSGPNEPYMDLMSWVEVIERPVELMAGAHRVEALKRYLKDEGRDTDPDERWWICTLYDKDRLPFELMLQLRANREDVLLQDSNGQIWHEMVTLSQHDPTLFHGNLQTVEESMKRCLRLNSRNNFPVRRLGTLWRNDQWRPMITRLCDFPLGQFLFSISTFEWMSSCRIDDFWFRPLQQVIDAAHLLETECQLHLTLSDWQQLSRHSTIHNTPIPDVERIFDIRLHKGGEDENEDDDEDDIRPIRSRFKGLFTKLTDDEYAQVYKTISQHPDLRFPDIQSFLKTSKTEGKLISSVLTHVGQWLHSHPFVVLDRAGTKPPLRQDFLPALRAKHGDAADGVSIDLQHQIAVFVKDHAKALTSHGVAHWLAESPVTHATTYRDRFHHASWSQLLNLVYDVCGPHFRGETMQYVNHEPPHTSSDQNRPSLSGVIYHALAGSPAILRNPILRQPSALDDLAHQLEPVIQQWVVQQCRSGLREDWRWPADVQAILREDLQLYTVSTSIDITGRQPTPVSTQASTQHEIDVARPPGTSDAISSTAPLTAAAEASTNTQPPAGSSAHASKPASSSHSVSLDTPRRAAPTTNFRPSADTDSRRSAGASGLTPRTNMKVGLSRSSHRKNDVKPSSTSPKLWQSPQLSSVSSGLDGEAAKRRKITMPGGSGWRKSLGVQSRLSQSR